MTLKRHWKSLNEQRHTVDNLDEHYSGKTTRNGQGKKQYELEAMQN